MLITASHQPQQDRVEIIAGRDKVFALHLFDQSMVGMMDKVSHELIEWIHAAKVQLIGKEMNANSVTYYLSGSSEPLNHFAIKRRSVIRKRKSQGEWLH